MTVRRYVTLWCDYIGPEGGCYAVYQTADHRADYARAMAKQDGWTVELPGGRDLCPQHVKED